MTETVAPATIATTIATSATHSKPRTVHTTRPKSGRNLRNHTAAIPVPATANAMTTTR
jgi:hypothetical protein